MLLARRGLSWQELRLSSATTSPTCPCCGRVGLPIAVANAGAEVKARRALRHVAGAGTAPCAKWPSGCSRRAANGPGLLAHYFEERGVSTRPKPRIRLSAAAACCASKPRRSDGVADRLGPSFAARVAPAQAVKGRVIVSGVGQIGPHRPQDRRDPHLDRHARELSPPGRQPARRPRHRRPRRCRDPALQERRVRRAVRVGGTAAALRRADHRDHR